MAPICIFWQVPWKFGRRPPSRKHHRRRRPIGQPLQCYRRAFGPEARPLQGPPQHQQTRQQPPRHPRGQCQAQTKGCSSTPNSSCWPSPERCRASSSSRSSAAPEKFARTDQREALRDLRPPVENLARGDQKEQAATANNPARGTRLL